MGWVHLVSSETMELWKEWFKLVSLRNNIDIEQEMNAIIFSLHHGEKFVFFEE